MDQKALKVLEYQKIIDMLCTECASKITMEEVKKLLPSSDTKKVTYELSKTDEAVQVLLKKGTPPLGNFYDTAGLAHLAAKDGVLSMKQLLEVSYNLWSVRRTKDFLSSDLQELPFIDNLVSAIVVLKNLEEEIKRCILSEEEMADSASPKLASIRREIIKKNEQVKIKLQQIMGASADAGLLQDALITMRQGRYVVPVKAENKSKVPGIVHDQSASGATLFIEPQAIVNLNNELTQLALDEQEEIQRILAELSAEVGAKELAIKADQDILFKLDLIFAKGRLACNMNAMKPEINTEGRVFLRKARHPLIDKKKVVPIDVSLGGDFDTLVVTGPNTGGKTVTLKTVGLLCLMAQAGLFIPTSDGSTLPVYKNIFADIGDEQSIEQSLSTFSSHMVNIVKIVESAGKNSLVLLDELGAGTDPTEGAALAISILDRLYGNGAQIIATTHYTELKKFALSTPGVKNASMEFDVETLSPTYKLIIGIPGKSNAFEISKKLGLDGSIIDYAKGFIESGDLAFEDVITKIDQDRKDAEAARREAEALHAKMEEQKQRMEELESKYEEKKAQLFEEAREEARNIIDEAKASVDAMQKELTAVRGQIDDAAVLAAERELNKSIEEAKKNLKEKRGKYVSKAKKAVRSGETPEAEDIVIGNRVNVIAMDSKGKILSLPDDKGNFKVQVGSIKLDVNLVDVTLVQENVTDKQREKIKYSAMYAAKAINVQSEINVIGQSLDDAKLNVDKYLDDAYMAGLETVTVVHGKGTGTLRTGLAEMFRHHKHVKDFRLGGLGEGAGGATIVTLKK